MAIAVALTLQHSLEQQLDWIDPVGGWHAESSEHVIHDDALRVVQSCGDCCFCIVFGLIDEISLFRSFVRMFRVFFIADALLTNYSSIVNANSLTGTIPQLVGLTKLNSMFVFAVCVLFFFGVS